LPPASDAFHHIRYFGFMANGCRAKMSRKRHILVDTLGLLLGVSVLPANIQDRDGARDPLREARRRFPFVQADLSISGAENGQSRSQRRMLEGRDNQTF
jgi:hypothetical protein